MQRTARLSPCGAYRSTLGRVWDDRPVLLVCMFNPSDADHLVDDPTITLLCRIARHNGFGGLVVVNGIPLRSSTAAQAVDMVNNWDKRCDWHARDRLQENVGVIVDEVSQAGAVLLAWGALADRCSNWFDNVREDIECALPEGVPLYCLGKTTGGYPKHPMARGKHKVPKDARLVLWREAV
ncbi:MAG: DUF1643 domain-containing protein [Methylibium sp.]|uniref:DUF1643 domain-containing protein n=1 Tax=Methylibium sp. TaxID=2067992 RepID=UPI00179811C7|nr:DUF1643 domain-containing protein [Methylibium sp.]MBA3597506.1 DUF1643 domain-containing protein [Methylibium sp.]